MSTQKELNLQINPEDVRINEEGAIEITNQDLTQQLIAYKRTAQKTMALNINCGGAKCNNYCKSVKAN
jgi:hypothetical protein